ncbi:EFR1 family ferrodoxin [uncultured Megasphaera sp.]|uniref:EFR1 family ferrodoxin n=1 Tax=uncultured Megasphaera sp. TaxID=165188 RepID=UPI0026584823|nr:EFR1 family ferrodoxin [uncultured Megasphaera sp.]
MSISHIHTAYFSPTGTTRTICTTLAQEMSRILNIPWKLRSFTLPAERKEPLCFSGSDLVILGVPVYAGRVPNVLLKFLNGIAGNGAMGIPIVVYGNRNYDDALIELRDLMESAMIHTIGGGAFIGEHSFSRTLGGGRPDAQDLNVVRSFAGTAASAIENNRFRTPAAVKGNIPYRPYMVPQTKDGGHQKISRVFPKVSDACTNCGICAAVCPMGAIAPDYHSYTSFCIKCCACVKACPTGARYYDDETYLFHKRQLEEHFSRRAEPETFI